ncbi:hypothetical protein [Synechococcus sp. CS-1328]|uniref:hypothetical protein n=1 Tax=Synechococcus sp. CS-1328 TaxID=2847976 RepID=UPI00223C2E39|nr:hypothetical protein [Synechococcus sp. CS-1328]MCT0225449.1 hypothetical protein [Synechococcus sp. CS-1328]
MAARVGFGPTQRQEGGAGILSRPAPSALREVAPPPGVQQLMGALGEHQPMVEILSPRNGSTLTEGDWPLQLAVRDWPLVDAGPLGLGPHLVVQIDGNPPLRLQDTDQLELSLPPLSPGSHRITAYAARPWGEAVKNPGAQAQIVVHRVAANPLGVPASGSPQMIVASPGATVSAQPVLLDWLLLDAPLQHLRPNDDSWRLRVTVNGDSFLVDRNEPLWLQGWRPGSNALVLELVDGQGEPLNAPFNSLVQEVRLEPGPRPIWQGNRLDALTVAQLLGEAPPPQPEVVEPVEPVVPTIPPVLEPSPEASPAPEEGSPRSPQADPRNDQDLTKQQEQSPVSIEPPDTALPDAAAQAPEPQESGQQGGKPQGAETNADSSNEDKESGPAPIEAAPTLQTGTMPSPPADVTTPLTTQEEA